MSVVTTSKKLICQGDVDLTTGVAEITDGIFGLGEVRATDRCIANHKVEQGVNFGTSIKAVCSAGRIDLAAVNGSGNIVTQDVSSVTFAVFRDDNVPGSEANYP